MEELQYVYNGEVIDTKQNKASPLDGPPQWPGETVTIKDQRYKIMARAGEKVFVTKVEGGD